MATASIDTGAMDAWADTAARKLAAGEVSDARTITRQILNTGHATVKVLDVAARAAAQDRDIDTALALVEKAIGSAGATLDRALLYGDLLMQKKRWQAAADAFQQIINQQEDNAQAWLGLGNCLYCTEDAARAAGCYRRVLALASDHRDAALKLVRTLMYLGDAYAAARTIEPFYDNEPDSAELTCLYGEALFRSSGVEQAVDVLRPHQNSPEWGVRIKKTLVPALLSMENLTEATELMEDLLARNPDDAGILGQKARLLDIQGERTRAQEIYEDIMVKQPDNYSVWEPYSGLIREPLSEAMLARLDRHREMARARNHNRYLASIHFAASRHYALAEDAAAEMEELNQANAVMAELESFDSAGHNANVMAIVRWYTAARIQQLRTDRESFRPVFILCPPRSGSTLLEQALARHERFWPGGEKSFAAQCWQEWTGQYSPSVTVDVDNHRATDGDAVQQMAELYEHLARAEGCSGDLRMVHKGINNYKFAGFLKALFPEAQFIELRRNPVDVAFGCYRMNFAHQPFSHTYEGCAAEVALFQQTMARWHEQMPESIYRVDYEDLVADFEGELRGLVAWLGQPWDPAMLDFAGAGTVFTASGNQVRKGLFQEGIGRWARYRDYLEPLLEALERHDVQWED